MKTTRIAVLQDLSLHSGRQIVSGVIEYASTRPSWEVRLYGSHCSDGDLIYPPDWQPDGIVCGYSSLHPIHTEIGPLRKSMFKVFTCIGHTERKDGNTLSIDCDDHAIGRDAASFLMRHKLASFGFVGAIVRNEWDDARFTGYSQKLLKHGFSTSRFAFKPDGCNDLQAALSEWVLSLPKPCGIFCSYDQRARHLLDVCHRSGIAVPEQVQVLGVDNEEWICERTTPSLSSMEIDFEHCGFMAAKAIDCMIAGRTFPKTIPVGLKTIVERMSTSCLHGDSDRAARAHEHIRLHATNGISASDVAAHVGCSVRILEKSYQLVYRRTVKEDISHYRMQHVCKLLKNTEYPIISIASKCGFSSSTYLMNAFRRVMGMSMREWRRKHLLR